MDGYSLQQAKAGAINFMKNLDPEYTTIGLVSFDSCARLRMPFTKSLKKLTKAVNALTASGSTDMAGALETSFQNFQTVEGQRVIVLLTDGYPDTVSTTLAQRDNCTRDMIDIITIGTDRADNAFLKKIATNDAGQVFAPVQDLDAVFGKIAQNLDEYRGLSHGGKAG
jgi:Mg-chelatase subunit ChlD